METRSRSQVQNASSENQQNTTLSQPRPKSTRIRKSNLAPANSAQDHEDIQHIQPHNQPTAVNEETYTNTANSNGSELNQQPSKQSNTVLSAITQEALHTAQSIESNEQPLNQQATAQQQDQQNHHSSTDTSSQPLQLLQPMDAEMGTPATDASNNMGNQFTVVSRRRGRNINDSNNSISSYSQRNSHSTPTRLNLRNAFSSLQEQESVTSQTQDSTIQSSQSQQQLTAQPSTTTRQQRSQRRNNTSSRRSTRSTQHAQQQRELSQRSNLTPGPSSQRFQRQENQQHVYVEGVNKETKLVDITIDKLAGALISLSRSNKFIPYRLRKQCRLAYNQCMKKIRENPQELLNWKKLMLLPTVLFVQPANKYRDTMEERIQKVIKDEWNFTLQDFRHREYYQANRPTFANRNQSSRSLAHQEPVEQFTLQQRKAHQQLLVGNISTAFKALCANPNPNPPSQEILNILKSKHFPANQDPNSPTNEDYQKVIDHQADIIDAVNSSTIYVLVSKQKQLIAPGADNLRYEHLKFLMGPITDKEADEKEFGDNLAHIITMLLNSKIPVAVQPLFADCQLIAGEKCRPISPSSVFRKLAAFCMLENVKEKSRKYFASGLQEALNKNGMENVIAPFKLNLEIRPEQDIFAMDADAAFQRSNRRMGLVNLLKEMPDAVEFLRYVYGTSSTVWYYGLQTGSQPVQSAEGWQQGDVTGTFGYCASTFPLLQELKALQAQNELLKFFVDDGSIGGAFASNVKLIEHLVGHGPKYGYHLHKSKGTYLLGKCASQEEAQQRKLQLIALGLADSIIRIHPDNVPNEEKEAAKLAYGTKILGTHIGTDEYIRANVNEQIEEMNALKQKLIDHPNMHDRMVMFRYCFCPKVVHLMRTVPPRLLTPSLDKFSGYKKDVLCTLFEFPDGIIDNRLFSDCCLPYSKGGLSLGDLTDTKHGAFMAGYVSAINSVKAAFPEFEQMYYDPTITHPTIVDLRTSAQILCDSQIYLPEEERDVFFRAENIWNTKAIRRGDQDVQHDEDDPIVLSIQEQFNVGIRARLHQESLQAITSPQALEWRTSISSWTASCWLDVTPKNDQSLSNDVYSLVLRLRYMLPLPCIPAGVTCNCKTHPIPDVYGHHLMRGCPNDGIRHRTHDHHKYAFRQILNWFKIPNKLEQIGCFQAVDPNCNKRPDLTIFKLAGLTDNDLILDVTVTSTLEGVSSGAIYNNTNISAPTRRTSSAESAGGAATSAAGGAGTSAAGAGTSAAGAGTSAAGAATSAAGAAVRQPQGPTSGAAQRGAEAMAAARARTAATLARLGIGAPARAGPVAGAGTTTAEAAQTTAGAPAPAAAIAVATEETSTARGAAGAATAATTAAGAGRGGSGELAAINSTRRIQSAIKNAGHKVKAAENAKDQKYQTVARQSGLAFMPCGVESSGRPGPSMKKVIEKICKYGAKEKKMDYRNLLRWCYKFLSINLQRTLVQGIKLKVGYIINKHSQHREDSMFSDDNVINHEIIHLSPLVVA